MCSYDFRDFVWIELGGWFCAVGVLVPDDRLQRWVKQGWVEFTTSLLPSNVLLREYLQEDLVIALTELIKFVFCHIKLVPFLGESDIESNLTFNIKQ